MSKRTHKCKTIKNWMSFLHILCLFLPILIFLPQAIIIAETSHKVILTLSGLSAIVLLFVGLLNDAIHRLSLHKTIVWIILLAMTICLTEATAFIIVMSILSIIDELIISPIRNKYIRLVEINKEIDKR